jgi:hypothetical protein
MPAVPAYRPLSRQRTTLYCINTAQFVKMQRSSTEDHILDFQSRCTRTGASPLRPLGAGEPGRPGLRASLIGQSPSALHPTSTPTPNQHIAPNQVSATKPLRCYRGYRPMTKPRYQKVSLHRPPAPDPMLRVQSQALPCTKMPTCTTL